MEHATLHALILLGLVLALGGPLAAMLLRGPVALGDRIARVTACGALLGTFATLLDLAVQVAEVEGRTVFGGVRISLLAQFATETAVGRLCLVRAGLLAAAAGVALFRPQRWIVVGALAFGAVVLASLVSHAAAQPEHRVVAIGGQILHIAAAAAWLGVLLHAWFARDRWAAETAIVTRFVTRFSPFALLFVATIFITGILAALRTLRGPEALFGSAYGWTLLVKLALLLPALWAGWWNFRHARTQPAAFPSHLELEVLAGVLVVTVAGILGSISPPGEDGSLRLTPAQFHALLSPDLPTSHVDDWTAPEDPRGPTDDDLRYSEVTHNWSGITVIALGGCWLLQSRGGRGEWWAARAVPLLLVPFGAFIAFASNPELWLLRTVPAGDALTNPQLLEHQLGAGLVFVLAWLAWRDRTRAPRLRPLGYPLPAIMLAGSLLLLGHAHSTLNVPDALTNLINVQHAIMGACGLFAGTLRLMQLRGLIADRAASLAWPGCVIALGVFMAFFYRELV